MLDCKSTLLPIAPTFDLSPSTDAEVEEALELDIPYRGIIGGLMWASLGSRPDITQSVSRLSRFSSRPSVRHFTAAKSILRYLKGTLDYCITYSRDTPYGFTPSIYSDADYAACPLTRRSTSAYIVLMSGGAVQWASRLQPSVALSTAEAEYMALGEASKQAIWLRLLLPSLVPDYGISPTPVSTPQLPLPTNIYGDNKGSIFLAQNPVDHKRTKHIDIHHHYIPERILDGEISLTWIQTNDNVADILTKGLDRDKHYKFCDMMGLVQHQWEC